MTLTESDLNKIKSKHPKGENFDLTNETHRKVWSYVKSLDDKGLKILRESDAGLFSELANYVSIIEAKFNVDKEDLDDIKDELSPEDTVDVKEDSDEQELSDWEKKAIEDYEEYTKNKYFNNRDDEEMGTTVKEGEAIKDMSEKFKIVNEKGATLAKVSGISDLLGYIGPLMTDEAHSLALRGGGISAFFSDLPMDGLIAEPEISWGDFEAGTKYYLKLNTEEYTKGKYFNNRDDEEMGNTVKEGEAIKDTAVKRAKALKGLLKKKSGLDNETLINIKKFIDSVKKGDYAESNKIWVDKIKNNIGNELRK